MRKAAIWALVVCTLLACGTFSFDNISNTSESGSFPANGSAEHSFPAVVDSPVTISVEPNEETFDPVLEVLDEDGNVLEESDLQADGLAEIMIFIPPATGTYRVRITDFSGEAGSYQIGIVTNSGGDDSRVVPTAFVQETVGDSEEEDEPLRIPPTWTPLSGTTGNVEQGTGAANGTAVPGFPPGTETYTVQAGDTLADIALHYGVSVYDLAEANNIENIDLIEVGQVLVIP